MWPISPIEIGGMSPKHPFIRVMQKGEDSFCKNSDIIVSLLPAAKDYFIEHGMKSNKFVYIPNGVVLEEWNVRNRIPEKIAEHFNRNRSLGKFNLCFFGSIHKTYNLDVLIDTVIKMALDNLAVTFIGPGLDKAELKEMTVGHENIFAFFDPIPKNTIPDLFNYIDASFVGAKSQEIFRFGISMNKLFDAMMGGKPILYMVDAPNNYAKEYKCGISVNGDKESDLENAIYELLSLDEESLVLMGKNGRRAIENIFNYGMLTKRFENIMH